MSTDLDIRREQLYAAAEAFTADKSVENQRGLCDAASAYATARFARTPTSQHASTNGNGARYVIPFGSTKGTPIGEATPKDLNFILGRLKEGLDDPGRARWRAKNAELIAAIEQELSTR